jgi:ubiquinone/menaquinone biosynthesis C-methylase UbiE
MYADGFQSIINIDISPIVVKYMEERYKTKCPAVQYKVMDVFEMKEFADGEFDVVIDKATFDSIICHDLSQKHAEIMLKEIYRVLNSTGVYICVSHGSEEIRREYFVKVYFKQKNFDWEFKVDKVVKPSNLITSNINDENCVRNFHFVYTLTKGPKSNV